MEQAEKCRVQATAAAARVRGFSLLEVLVATLVLAVLVAGIGSFFTSTSNFYVFALGRDEVMDRGRRLLEELSRELMLANLLAVGTGGDPNSSIYVVPVDIGEDSNGNGVLDAGEDVNGNGLLDLTDGDVVSPAGDIEFGCLEELVPSLDTVATPHRIQVTFQQEGAISESAEGADINGDGDTGDAFFTGSIRRTTSGGASRTLGGGMVVLGDASGPADLDGDGTPDPLFTVGGEAFVDANANGVFDATETYTDSNGNGRWDGFWRVQLTLYLRDGKGNPHFVHLQREITPRNLPR